MPGVRFSPALWGLLGAAIAMVGVTLALMVALVIYNRRFLRLHHTYADGLLRTQEQERSWVAAEVHDDALQRIAVLLHELDACGRMLPAEATDVRRRVAALRAEMEDLSHALRQMAYRLHPAFLAQVGLPAALRQLAGEVTRSAGIHVQVEAHGVHQAIAEDQALVVYRIAQEALQNLVRHAGAGRARVALTWGERAVELVVEDAGRGFVPDEAGRAGGLGLISMAERARAAGGALSIDSSPGNGTRVSLHLPIKAAA